MQKDVGRDDLRQRTTRFALQIIQLYGSLPTRVEATILGKQLLRSGTSVGANYREAHRSRDVYKRQYQSLHATRKSA